MDVLLPWLQREGGFAANWPEGLLYFIVGLVAALVMIYLSAGELLPSMGSKARITILEADIAALEERHDVILKLREACTQADSKCPEWRVAALNDLSDDLEAMTQTRVSDLRSEKRYALTVAIPLYVLLGGVFATAFATSLAIAIFIGFAWTAVADRIGLRREESVRDEARSGIADELGAKAMELQSENQELTADLTEREQEIGRLTDQLDELRAAGNYLMDQLKVAAPENEALKGA